MDDLEAIKASSVKVNESYHSNKQQIYKTRVEHYLISQVMVFLFFIRLQCVPPLPKDLRHSPVILIRVLLVDEMPMPLTEDHKGVHWPPNMVLLFGLKIIGEIDFSFLLLLFKQSSHQFLLMLRWTNNFLSIHQYYGELMCLAQGYNLTPTGFQPLTSR